MRDNHFPYTDGSGTDMWVFYTMLFRDDDRFYEHTGSRPTESDAILAAASFGLLVSGDEQDGPKAESSRPQIPEGAIEWTEAGRHVGGTVTVFGPVVGSDYAIESEGRTYIDIGAPYPDASRVSIVIWAEDRDQFPGRPEEIYLGRTISVTGELYIYGGACKIEVRSPSQIRVLE